jgi:hypothetical protein
VLRIAAALSARLGSGFHSSIFQSFNFRLRISILQFFNPSIFVAYTTTVCAPKGQLLLAQGIALGKRLANYNAPCKGSCITQSVGCSEDAATTTFHILMFTSFNINAAAPTGRGNGGICCVTQGAALGYM